MDIKESPKEVLTSDGPPTTQTENIQKNYEDIIKQQQTQIEQLIKQQELNKKVNDQLTESLRNAQKTLLENAEPKDNRHWIDRQLEDNFSFKAEFNPMHMNPSDTNNTSQIATWYLQYLKENGCSNAEIANRMKNIFENKDIQENPEIRRN